MVGHCGMFHLKENESCHSREDTEQSLGSPSTPTKGPHRRSSECHRASRVRTTTVPLAGPTSAKPTFSRPASICFSEPNEVFAPNWVVAEPAGVASLASALVELNIP